jgi:hypothetical protein
MGVQGILIHLIADAFGKKLIFAVSKQPIHNEKDFFFAFYAGIDGLYGRLQHQS